MSEHPRISSADSLDGSENPAGLVTHVTEPQTHEADDVANESTGTATAQFSETDQPETDGTVTTDEPEPVTKVVTPPDPTGTASQTQAETA